MSAAEAAEYRRKFEAYEAELGCRVTEGDPASRYKTHVLLPFAARLARHPRILDAVEALVGPDILCWTSTWFVKDAHTEAQTIWHQDATYFGLRPHRHVTAWLALSEASEEAGCMRFVPGTNRGGLLRHIANAAPNSINSAGQRTEVDFEPADAVPVPLKPGQFSIHHTLAVHASGPNEADDRRIGIGFSYIPASVRHIGTVKVPATLVRGEDRYGHFELEERPEDELDWDTYRRYRAAYSESYAEQVEWHAAGRWE
ncbi:MAG: phytanoyl-CoA dioxygenase family protein [Alphaproteobacteria bacterium]|nr:phytanoyl-CoA dioxygenase family protein [Alphaproteobacteria bacterium]